VFERKNQLSDERILEVTTTMTVVFAKIITHQY